MMGYIAARYKGRERSVSENGGWWWRWGELRASRGIRDSKFTANGGKRNYFGSGLGVSGEDKRY